MFRGEREDFAFKRGWNLVARRFLDSQFWESIGLLCLDEPDGNLRRIIGRLTDAGRRNNVVG
jgi:hypothetical protein